MSGVMLVDTTLRDGEQAPGFAFSHSVKVRFAHLLDAAGVYQIEAGVPAMGAAEKQTIRAIMDVCLRARVSVWNRLKLDDIRHSLDCQPHIIHVCCPVSERQIQGKLQSTRREVLKTLVRCIALAGHEGATVSVGLEDASFAEGAQLHEVAHILSQEGVRRVRLSDTVGRYVPEQVRVAVGTLCDAGLEVEMHAHNDFGMAVANSWMAVRAGAQYVDTTLWGIGERAGNCAMQVFLEALERDGHVSCAVSACGAAALEAEAAALLPENVFMRWHSVPHAGRCACHA